MNVFDVRAELPEPSPGSVCGDGSACSTSDACSSAQRCERIVCWNCPYAKSCQYDPMTSDLYGDPYNCDVEPGVDCLAAK